MTTTAPEADDPWVLHIVARVERPPAGPPSGADVLALAARAVVRLLDDERARPGGPWADAIAAWEGVSIRKVARRARGAAWARAAADDGVLVRASATLGRSPSPRGENDGDDEGEGQAVAPPRSALPPVEVIALPPTRRSATPRTIDVLQVGGTDLSPAPPLRTALARWRAEQLSYEAHGLLHPAGATPPLLLVLAPVAMTTGKAMAQVGHAAQLARRTWLDTSFGATWSAAGRPILVATSDPSHWAQVQRGATLVVHDAGHTEVEPGTVTVAVLPFDVGWAITGG